MDKAGGTNPSGSSLLECVLGVALLAGAALALAAMQAAWLRGAQRARDLAQASALLQDRAAALRAHADVVDACRSTACGDSAWLASTAAAWNASIAAELVEARGSAVCTGAPPQPCQLRLRWRDGTDWRTLQLAVWR